MKKFVIVMISALVLFVFLMLNYLVWDKENLQNQRNSDKIEQDWLRGQNRILNATVEELEQAVEQLKKDITDQKNIIQSLEAEARISQQQQSNSQKNILKQEDALNFYKSLFADDLRGVTEDWFLSITQKKHKDSLDLLDKDFTFWGRGYKEDEYIKLISAIDSISLAENNGAENGSFIIFEGGEPLVIKAHVAAKVNIANDLKDTVPGLTEGINSLEIGYSYNSVSKNWIIIYINTKTVGNP